MKKILMIAPASYPVNGAEAIVNIKLLKALSDSGKFEIDLISKKNKWENYASEPFENLGINLRSLNIVEVDNKINIKTIWQHLMSLILFGVVFKGCHWAVEALSIAKKLVVENKYDFIVTKNAPSLLLGYYLKKKYGVKWIATWNDPYPVAKYPSPYGKGADAKENHSDKALIKIMNNWVDYHLFPSDRLRTYMMKYLSVSIDKTKIIPHVVLPYKEGNELNLYKEDILKILHSGNLQNPRNPETFFLALRRFIHNNPTLKIEVTIMGVYDKNTANYIKASSLDNVVKVIPSVSYNESLQILKDYHVALIIEADCEEGIFLPTKVSDFMQCGKPIFAVSPKKGVLKDLCNETYIGYFADVRNIDAIYEEISKLYNDFKDGKLEDNIKIPEEYKSDDIVSQYLKF